MGVTHVELRPLNSRSRSVLIHCRHKEALFWRTLRKTLRMEIHVGGSGTMTVYVIAEAGVNHNGSLSLAKTMVDEAEIRCGLY